MVYKSGQIFLPFCHNSRVCQTDRQTDGRTDSGQTDRNLITIPRLHYMQRGKNWMLWPTFLPQKVSMYLQLLLRNPSAKLPNLVKLRRG